MLMLRCQPFVGAGIRRSAAHQFAPTIFRRYMAPEVVRRERYNEEAEVYCFALVLYELVVHAVPFVG